MEHNNFILISRKAIKNNGATMDYYSKPHYWELLPYEKREEESILKIFSSMDDCLLEVKKINVRYWILKNSIEFALEKCQMLTF